MIIQTSTKLAKINEKVAPNIKDFVADKQHYIAASGEISKALGIIPDLSLSITPSLKLHPVTSVNSSLSAEQELEIKEAIDNFKKSMSLLKKSNPELTGTIGSIELVLATKEVVESITDTESDSKIKPWIAGGKAIMKLLSVIDPIFPQIKQIPHFETFSVIFTIGTSAYHIYSDVAKPTTEVNQNPFLKIKNAAD